MKILVRDESMAEIAEVAVGKNTLTGEWVASLYFGDPPEEGIYENE